MMNTANTSKPVAGKIYLIPCFLSEGARETLPAYVAETAAGLRHFFVENERSARRFLKAVCPALDISSLHLYLVNEHQPADRGFIKKMLASGTDAGVISEAGYPGIADPGQAVVLAAHEAGATVVPLVGPSSVFLALAASGLNGQRFQFNGYLPVKPPARIKMLGELEKRSRQAAQTEIFIETPYRNKALTEDLLKHCREDTLLCIAADITGGAAFIRTHTIKEWRRQVPELHKRPAIFLLLAR